MNMSVERQGIANYLDITEWNFFYWKKLSTGNDNIIRDILIQFKAISNSMSKKAVSGLSKKAIARPK